MTDLERAILHIKTRADAWAVKEIEKALLQEPCADAVSREDAITAISQAFSWVVPSHPSKEVREILNKCKENLRELPSVTQKPIECDDAISRDMALEKMADYVASGYADSAEDFEEYSRIICQLPSVTQKSGKWINKEISNPDYPFQDRKIIECSKCHYGIVQARLGYTNYCPNCGAKMESEE